MKANQKIVEESVCGLCAHHFFIGDEVIKCEKCGNFFHPNCWSKSGGCNQTSCKEGMKQCPSCKIDVKESALKCWHCGYYFDQSINPNLAETVQAPQELHTGLKILAFCIPLAGAIMYFVYSGKEPVKSKAACTYALWGFLAGILLRLLSLASR
jgi:hypothetical protein